jgi:hypothetical protein
MRPHSPPIDAKLQQLRDLIASVDESSGVVVTITSQQLRLWLTEKSRRANRPEKE